VTRGAASRLVLALALTTGCARGSHYGVGYGVQSGAAVLPPTAARGTTAMVGYHEQGGVVARTIILVAAAAGLRDPNGDRSTTVSYSQEQIGDTVYTTRTTTTTYTPTTDEERAARVAAIEDFEQRVAPGIMSAELPVELNILWARQDLGDTSGGRMDMLLQVAGTARSALALGFGYEHLTFHARDVASLVDDGLTLTRQVAPQTLEHVFVGFPIRYTQLVSNRTSLFAQWDLNIASLTDDYVSPLTVGAVLQLPVLTLKGTVTAGRLELGATSVGVEAIVGF
jgi:hypothetical protein